MPETIVDRAAELVFELESFDGPLDLLLYLIRKDEVDIYDIPIAEITRQYLAYLEACRELNLEIAGEFLYMAAVLVRIKARMLLPGPEDDEQWEDPRTELINALQEYKNLKYVSSALEEMAVSRHQRYPRRDFTLYDIPPPEAELAKVDLTTLMIAFGHLMSRVETESSYELEPLEITVEARRDRILSLFEQKESMEFDELFEDDLRKIVMVITFIALLELVKLGVIRVEQAERFSTIRVYKRSPMPAEVPGN
jgi:segregation and condensation protein A